MPDYPHRPPIEDAMAKTKQSEMPTKKIAVKISQMS
jgi:hypothetical protein